MSEFSGLPAPDDEAYLDALPFPLQRVIVNLRERVAALELRAAWQDALSAETVEGPR